jgi:hypothetical protein
LAHTRNTDSCIDCERQPPNPFNVPRLRRLHPLRLHGRGRSMCR